VQTFGVELTTTLDDLLASVAEDDAALDALADSEGTMTLMFTDIVGSTVLAEHIGDDEWVALIKHHESDIRRITARHRGTVVKMLGDGSMLAFNSSRAAARAALDVQKATLGQDYQVRIGLHAGEVVRREGDLLGLTVNKAARVASVAGAGQILVSALVAELVGEIDELRFGPQETFTLKGLSGTHNLVPVEPAPPHHHQAHVQA
jgi:class 3 adenylate cyclase